MSAPTPAEDVAPLHMWRLTVAGFGAGSVCEYVCELCHEHLRVPAGGVHPLEC